MVTVINRVMCRIFCANDALSLGTFEWTMILYEHQTFGPKNNIVYTRSHKWFISLIEEVRCQRKQVMCHKGYAIKGIIVFSYRMYCSYLSSCAKFMFVIKVVITWFTKRTCEHVIYQFSNLSRHWIKYNRHFLLLK